MRKLNSPLKGLKAFLMSSVLLMLCNISFAQFITYPSPAQAITRGLDSSLLTVQVAFPACTGVTITVNLGATNAPGLIEYIPGSVTKTSGVGTITESNISDLRNPVFSIGTTTFGQSITFTLRRRAYCGSAASSKDNIVVTGTGAGCNFSETNANVNTYTLLAPAFTITPPASLVNANVGDAYNRTITIVNGGNGCADTIGFWIKYPSTSMQLNSLTVGGNPLTAIYTDGDSSYFQLSGTQLGADGKLCNGETVSLIENVTILQCNVVTTYGVAGFDFSGTRCQARTAVSGMSMNNATPSIVVTATVPTITSCFVSAPRAVSYKIKNNGGGPATNIVINTGAHFNNLTTTDAYGYIDTASIQITIQGQPSFHPDPSYFTAFTTNAVTATNSLACNTGKINNMRITLPASIILGTGDSIVITYNYIYCASTNSCTDAYAGTAQGTQVSYKNACANTTYSTGNYVGSSSYPYNQPSIASFEFPAQVRAGDCYDVTLSTPALPTSNISTRGYIEYSLTMPAGVTFSSATLIGVVGAPHTGYPRVVGNTVLVRYPVSTGSFPVKFVFCTPSNLCTTENLDAVITTSPDSLCELSNPANINSAKRCQSSPINFVCTGPCAGGGTVPVYWNYRRKNFGSPDNNYNKMPDGSGSLDPAVVYDDRYRPGDTLHSEYRSYIVAQTSPASITSWQHINSNWTFSAHIWAPVGTATVTVVRAGNSTVVPNVPIATVAYGKQYNADFSQGPSALTLLAPFQPNDSIIIEADFVLKDSILSGGGSTEHMTAVDDATSGKAFADAPEIVLLSNTVYASATANPVPAERFTCFVPQYNANVLHLFHQSLLYGSNLVGCSAVRHEVRGFTRKLSGYTANYFPGEYRPEFIPDSLILLFPAGMTVIPGSQYVAGLYNNTPPTAPLVTGSAIAAYVSINGSALTGTTVVFDVRAALAANPTWLIQSEGTTYNFGMDARGGCATPNAFSIQGRQVGHLFEWPSASAQVSYSDSAKTQISSTYTLLNKPNVNLSSPDATITPSSDTASWALLLQNSSAQPAPLNFIRITPNASFTDVVVMVGSSVITANGDGIYELGNINAGATNTVTILANTNSCSLDSMKVESGWDCAAYPSGGDLAGYACWKQLWVKADPLPSQIQLSVDRQPVTPSITLCATDTMIFKMNSALANYSDNPQFRVTIPDGLSIATGEIEYPEGSGNWETITAVVEDGVLVYNIEEHTGVGDAGLPGTVSNPGTANRAARLRLTYSTTCDFVSGSKVSVQQRADRPCGSPVSNDLGFNGIVRANPINITGVAGAGVVGFNLILNPGNISCDLTTISGNITPSGESTSAADTIVVTIPAGLEYAGNFTSPDGMSVVSGYPVEGPGGSQILKLKVPEGVTSGTSVNYSFDIRAAFVNLGCGKLDISSQMERTVAALMCNGNACPNGAKFVVGSSENQVAVAKPELLITGFEYVSGGLAEGGTATLAVTVSNISLLQAPANMYYVEFFCGSNTTPFTSVLFPTEIPQSGSVTENLTINIPVAPACINGESLSIKIRPLTADNQQQCLCNETTRGMLDVLPVVLSSFTARQSACKISLQWRSETELNFKKYEVEYSTNGRTFAVVGSVDGRGSSSSYNFNHQPSQGRVYYRLRIIDNNGSSRYSDIITMNISCTGKNVLVYPNPATSLLNVNLSGFTGAANGRLYNSTGQLISTQQLLNGTNTISVDKLATGNYALVVTEPGGAQQVYRVQVSH
jgi:hypothetical protein